MFDQESFVGRKIGSDDAKQVVGVAGHLLALSWLGAVRDQRIKLLGVARFGQSGDIADLYRVHSLGAAAIVAGAEAVLGEAR